MKDTILISISILILFLAGLQLYYAYELHKLQQRTRKLRESLK